MVKLEQFSKMKMLSRSLQLLGKDHCKWAAWKTVNISQLEEVHGIFLIFSIAIKDLKTTLVINRLPNMKNSTKKHKCWTWSTEFKCSRLRVVESTKIFSSERSNLCLIYSLLRHLMFMKIMNKFKRSISCQPN